MAKRAGPRDRRHFWREMSGPARSTQGAGTPQAAAGAAAPAASPPAATGQDSTRVPLFRSSAATACPTSPPLTARDPRVEAPGELVVVVEPEFGVGVEHVLQIFRI